MAFGHARLEMNGRSFEVGFGMEHEPDSVFTVLVLFDGMFFTGNSSIDIILCHVHKFVYSLSVVSL